MESFNTASHENNEPEIAPGLEIVREIKKPEPLSSDIEGGLQIINEIIKREGDEAPEKGGEKPPTLH